MPGDSVGLYLLQLMFQTTSCSLFIVPLLAIKIMLLRTGHILSTVEGPSCGFLSDVNPFLLQSWLPEKGQALDRHSAAHDSSESLGHD